MYQNVKLTCRAIVFAHKPIGGFMALSLPSPSSLLKFMSLPSRQEDYLTIFICYR